MKQKKKNVRSRFPFLHKVTNARDVPIREKLTEAVFCQFLAYRTIPSTKRISVWTGRNQSHPFHEYATPVDAAYCQNCAEEGAKSSCHRKCSHMMEGFKKRSKLFFVTNPGVFVRRRRGLTEQKQPLNTCPFILLKGWRWICAGSVIFGPPRVS